MLPEDDDGRDEAGYDAIDRRADEIYAAINPDIIAAHEGQLIVMNIDTGEFDFDRSFSHLLKKAHKRWDGQKGFLYIQRVVEDGITHEILCERLGREAGAALYGLLIEAHEKGYEGQSVPIKQAKQLIRAKDRRSKLMLAVGLKLLKLDEPEANVISAGPLLDFFINGDDDISRFARP